MDLREVGRSGADTRDKGLGERVCTELEIRIEADRIQVHRVFRKNVSQHRGEGVVSATIMVSPAGGFAVPAVAVGIVHSALAQGERIFDERLREFLAEGLIFERAVGRDVGPAWQPGNETSRPMGFFERLLVFDETQEVVVVALFPGCLEKLGGSPAHEDLIAEADIWFLIRVFCCPVVGFFR